ncbi:hypothetical protein [Actibacterium sp. 188UL27-1]|uniref:hypothetical protein n=1 Tax=Actibacterium sp. 188UL27-1 TaxID=2786961 RepID=UPI00195EC36E|nr:hypothetical protein [Actibacterium sp. 188UL27-1]MBM7066716.1 hypothetical protein [Actibacterium sp. 188UL27-1]
MKGDALDPKGLIQDSYRIDGISSPECRSIFVDWALSTGAGIQDRAAIMALLERYGAEAPDHPMTAVLKEGLATDPGAGKRRGGRKGRVAS